MTRAGAATAGVATLLLSAVFSGLGCVANRPSGMAREAPPPSFHDVATQYNRRIERLDRIWARAVVELRFIDEKDRRRREQGEGHLQIRRPDQFALSVGKLGETYAWLGGDAERFWFFDKFDEPRVAVGRHENAGRPCSDSLGLPATPREMIDLMGVTPIPTGANGATDWSDDGRWIAASFQRRGAVETLFLDEQSLLPVRIEFAAQGQPPDLIAELERYEAVRQGDEGGYFPLMASRINIFHVSSSTRVTLHLSAMEDGSSGRGRLSDAAFDFDTLVNAFAPQIVHVLDRNCPTPAMRP